MKFNYSCSQQNKCSDLRLLRIETDDLSTSSQGLLLSTWYAFSRAGHGRGPTIDLHPRGDEISSSVHSTGDSFTYGSIGSQFSLYFTPRSASVESARLRDHAFRPQGRVLPTYGPFFYGALCLAEAVLCLEKEHIAEQAHIGNVNAIVLQLGLSFSPVG